jgi:hypothetical protein
MALNARARRPVLPLAPAPGTPRFARRAGAVAAAGLVGVAALLLQPLPPDLAALGPATAGWPLLAVKALLALNPAVLVLVAALLGAALSHRVGLRSLCAGTAPVAGWRRVLGRSAVLGLVLGLGVGAVDALWQPHLGVAWQRLAASPPEGAAALAGAMLYGGLAEEVLMRWGVMSLVAWALAALPRPWPRQTAMPVAIPLAIIVAAALFAAAHLPMLAVQIELTPGLVVRTLAINGAAGLVYGWLSWRHHLEAAMAAHASTHLGLAAWRALAA